jgi:hypothetical protein
MHLNLLNILLLLVVVEAVHRFLEHPTVEAVAQEDI